MPGRDRGGHFAGRSWIGQNSRGNHRVDARRRLSRRILSQSRSARDHFSVETAAIITIGVTGAFWSSTGGWDLPAAMASAILWLGDGRTPEHWRDTNARIEGPAVKFLQAAFAESWLETTGTAIGGAGYFPRLSRSETCRRKSSAARRRAAASRTICSSCSRSIRRANRF